MGKCDYCEVKGCRTCVEGKISTCAQCLDCSASIKDGKCECQSGYRMNN